MLSTIARYVLSGLINPPHSHLPRSDVRIAIDDADVRSHRRGTEQLYNRHLSAEYQSPPNPGYLPPDFARLFFDGLLEC